MKIAIIGAGFAGLATAHFLYELSPGISVTLFDGKGIGGGASSVCSGLVHPYPGQAARRSARAKEALAILKELIALSEKHSPHKVALARGIYREAITDEQRERLRSHVKQYGDVEEVKEGLFLLHSGFTVYPESYLAGLFTSLQKRGASLEVQEVGSCEELSHFDHIVIAAGYGVKNFPECSDLRLKFLKGQAMRIEGKPPYERSYISKGYLAHLGRDDCYDLGATYEREFVDEKPDPTRAKELLPKQINGKIMSYRAGVRVCPTQHYLPIAVKLSEKISVFTGLGSRGLLYHGLYGRILSNNILFS